MASKSSKAAKKKAAKAAKLQQVPAGSVGLLSSLNPKFSQDLTGQMPFSVSECARDYFQALMHPREAKPTCVPIWPALPSLKLKIFARGSMSTGPGGVGWICARPCAASDNACVFFTQDQYPGTDVTAYSFIPVLNQIASAVPNSQFAAISFGGNGPAQIQQKCVACGLYVCYTGPVLDMAGEYRLYEQQNHDSLAQYTPGLLLNNENCERVRVSANEVMIAWQPRLAEEAQDYATSPFPPQTNGTFNSNFVLTVTVAGAGATPLSFYWEYFAIYEFMGDLARGKTPSHVDTLGFGLINNTMAGLQQIDSETHQAVVKPKTPKQQARRTSWIQKIGNFLGNLTGFHPIRMVEALKRGDVGRAAESVIPGLVGGIKLLS